MQPVRWRRRLYEAVLVVLALAALAGALRLVNDVRTGHGLDYYFNGFGVRMNAISALATIGFFLVLLLVEAIVSWWRPPREPG